MVSVDKYRPLPTSKGTKKTGSEHFAYLLIVSNLSLILDTLF